MVVEVGLELAAHILVAFLEVVEKELQLFLAFAAEGELHLGKSLVYDASDVLGMVKTLKKIEPLNAVVHL